MRRRLILVFVAVSTLVATAFIVPLGFLVRRTAEDRAIDTARSEAAAVVPALAAGGDRDQIVSAMAVTSAGQEGRLTVITTVGLVVGPEIEHSEAVTAALEAGASSIDDVPDGKELVSAVAFGPGDRAAVRVYVPTSTLRRGQWRAWSTLAGVGVLLVLLSVVVADRLARTVVRPTQHLVSAARRLGEGDLEASVDPEGPEELVELAGTFNQLGSRIASMLDHEREMVAELSHRLRTPLTKLRMRVEQMGDAEEADAFRADVADLTSVVDGVIQEARGNIGADAVCDVGEVVLGRAEFWEVLADDQGRPWSFEQSGPPAVARVRRADLSAAVDVLFENIFTHTPDGIPVAIGVTNAEGWIAVRVEDGGPGIPMGVERRGESEGGSTGLGLDIARRFAETADGELVVQSGALGGAEVILRLPSAGSTG